MNNKEERNASGDTTESDSEWTPGYSSLPVLPTPRKPACKTGIMKLEWPESPNYRSAIHSRPGLLPNSRQNMLHHANDAFTAGRLNRKRRHEDSESEKENIQLDSHGKPKRRAIGIRGELAHIKQALTKIEREQTEVRKQLVNTFEAVQSGMDKISQILEGECSQAH